MIKTIALRAIVNCWQSQPLFPTVDKERTPPVPIITAHFFLLELLFFTIMLELIEQHLRRDPPLWCRRTLSFFLRLLPFDFIDQNLSSGINSPSRLWRQHLCLEQILFPANIHHVCRERMLINFHRLLRGLKFEPSLLDGRLYLLMNNFSIIGVMRCCIVPLAIPHILELLVCWDFVIRLQLNLLFR